MTCLLQFTVSYVGKLQDDEAVTSSISTKAKTALSTAMSLCRLSSTSAGPNSNERLAEADLLEPMSDPGALDDWLNVGPEEATETIFPDVFRLLDTRALEAVNWPNLWDLIYLTAWFYSTVLLCGLSIAWVGRLRTWIMRFYGVELDS